MVPTYYFVTLAAILWLALLTASSGLRLGGWTRSVNLALGAVALLILFLPVGGVRLGSWAYSVCPNPSVPLLGMACAGLWRRLSGVAVFKSSDWHAMWIFGAVAGSALYLNPMLFPSLDLYYWGWDREGAGWCLAALAMVFLARGNRFGVFLLAALMADGLDALESANCWDYVVDPFYWLIGLGVTATRGVAWLRERRSLVAQSRVKAA